MAKKSGDYVIATRLTLSGEKEFNTAMKQAAETTKALNADMELAKAKFAASGNETEFLADKLRILGEQLENKKGQLQMMNDQLEGMRAKSAQAEEKVRQLEQQLALTPQGTAEWQRLKDQLDNAKLASTRTAKELKTLESAAKNTETAAYKLQAEINDTTEAQEKLGRESEEAGQKIESNLGDAADEVENKFKRMSKSITQDLGEIKKMQKLSIAIDLVSKGANAAGQIYNFVSNAANEGMKDAMAEYNITASGGDAEQARAQMQEYNAIFGDKDSAREAVANLAALNLSQAEYSKAAKAIGGAAIKFQDTLKVEGLADSLQESISTAALTGPIASFFERMESETGVTTEEINAGLAYAKDMEAAGYEGAVEEALLTYLEASGIGDYYDNFKEQNADLIAAAEATKSIEQTLQEIATEVATVMAPMLEAVATDILPPVADAIKAIKGIIGGSGYTEEDAEIDAEAVRQDYKNRYGEEEGEKKYKEMLEQQEAQHQAWQEEQQKKWEEKEMVPPSFFERAGAWTLVTVANILDWTGLMPMRSAGGEELPADATPNRESWPVARPTTATPTGASAGGEELPTTATPNMESWPIALQYREAPDKTKIAWQVRAQWGGRTPDTEPTPTDLDGVSQQLDELATKGTETGQDMMTNMANGAQENIANMEAVQQQAREMVEAIWKPDISATVVVGYQMGGQTGSVNQNLKVELQPQPVQLDGQTVTKILRDPLNVMFSKMVNQQK